jgi:thioredoxin 1
MITEIKSTEQFDNTIKDPSVTLVDFYADWCGPCKMLSPTLESFAKSAPATKVVKVNVDDHIELAARFSIRGIPALLWFKNGQVVHSQTGSCSVDTLKKVNDQITDSVT